jgi:hypothetical protein
MSCAPLILCSIGIELGNPLCITKVLSGIHSLSRVCLVCFLSHGWFDPFGLWSLGLSSLL